MILLMLLKTYLILKYMWIIWMINLILSGACLVGSIIFHNTSAAIGWGVAFIWVIVIIIQKNQIKKLKEKLCSTVKNAE
jgi:hypothetical protein